MARATRTFLGLSLALVASAAWAVAGDEPKEPPKIRSVVPASAFRGQTVDVAIEGTALYPADEVSSTRPEIGIVVQTSSTPFKLMLRLTIPDTAAAGSVPITVKTKIGTIKTEKLQVKLRTPVVNRVRPDLVRRGAEYDLVVEGLRLAITGAETKATVDPPMTAKRTASAAHARALHSARRTASSAVMAFASFLRPRWKRARCPSMRRSACESRLTR